MKIGLSSPIVTLRQASMFLYIFTLHRRVVIVYRAVQILFRGVYYKEEGLMKNITILMVVAVVLGFALLAFAPFYANANRQKLFVTEEEQIDQCMTSLKQCVDELIRNGNNILDKRFPHSLSILRQCEWALHYCETTRDGSLGQGV